MLIYMHNSGENLSPVNKPTRLISPKLSGPEVGLISVDYSISLWREIFQGKKAKKEPTGQTNFKTNQLEMSPKKNTN